MYRCIYVFIEGRKEGKNYIKEGREGREGREGSTLRKEGRK
jgi:hypothetical protein